MLAEVFVIISDMLVAVMGIWYFMANKTYFAIGIIIASVAVLLTRIWKLALVIQDIHDAIPKKRSRPRRNKPQKTTMHRVFSAVITELLCLSAIYVLKTNNIEIPAYIIVSVLTAGGIVSLIF